MPQYKKGRKSPWQVQYHSLVGSSTKVITKSFVTKEDALDFEAHIHRNRKLRDAGMPLPPDEIDFESLCRQFMQWRELNYPQATWSIEGTRLKHWVIHFGKRPIQGIARHEIEDHLDKLQLELKLAAATRNRHRSLLHTMWEWAIDRNKAIFNPVARIPVLSEKKKKRKIGRWDTLAQVGLYIEGMTMLAPEYGLAAIVLCFEGPRVGELIALRNCDVDRKLGHIIVRRTWEKETREMRERTKGQGEGGQYLLPLMPKVAAAIDAFKSKYGHTAPMDFLVCREHGGPISYEGFRKAHEKAIKTMGLPRITIHDLRRTFASLAEEHGFSKEDIQKMLGHASVTTTERNYTKMNISHLVEKARKLGFGE